MGSDTPPGAATPSAAPSAERADPNPAGPQAAPPGYPQPAAAGYPPPAAAGYPPAPYGAAPPQYGMPVAQPYMHPQANPSAYPGPAYHGQGAPGYVYVPPQPIPGVPIKAPMVAPQPGMIITSYQVVEPKAGCCVCGSLNETGLIAFIVLLLFFWPLAWLPCVMQECHQKSQVPVYGYPPRPAA